MNALGAQDQRGAAARLEAIWQQGGPRQWLLRPETTRGEWTVLHAPPREARPGAPLAFAPRAALKG